MARIGILTCSNTTQDVACSSFGCLKDVNNNTGEFERYREEGGTELVGIINCAGCPTRLTPEKIIGELIPDILVKGSDWDVEKIVGREVVLNNGGEVKTIEFVSDQSTSNIIKTITNRFK